MRRKFIIPIVIEGILIIFISILLTFSLLKCKRLEEFNPLKQGVCVYVEYSGTTTTCPPVYCLVYDEEIDKVIEIDLFHELVHGHFYQGDIIVYIANADYTDIDFINYISK